MSDSINAANGARTSAKRIFRSVLAFGAALGLGLSVLAASKPATQPAGGTATPATMPSHQATHHHAAAQAAHSPMGVAAPATRPAAAHTFPTPNELWARINAQREAVTHEARFAYFDLDQPLAEKPAAFSLFGDSSVTVHDLVDRLHAARDDHNLRGVLITFGSTSFNLAQAQEIRSALDDLRRAGKRTFVYADSYDTDTYTAASGATDVCMLGGGDIMMPGVGLETMFYKGLFDKLGVQADYVQIGEYKGADESYTRVAPSEELKGELNKITQGIYDQLITGISEHRNIDREVVKQAIDEAIITGSRAKDLKLVDHLVDEDGLRSLLKDELGQDVGLVRDYGAPEVEKPDFSSPFALFSFLTRKPAPEAAKPTIALIHAEGVIVDGSAGESLFGGSDQIGSDDLRRAFRIASREPNVKAIVLRIDSPGGSALASEVMWQAARHAAANKPLIVSVGSMAASGGYYLASSGDYIFADPSAIVGSIGVVGGKFVVKDLYAKLGLMTESFTKGRNADLFSMDQPFTDRQRRMVTNWMRQTYDQFTQRVMTYRQGKIKDIDDVARGRVFIAKQAKDLGMVDALGGVDDAIAYAAKEVGLQQGGFDVRIVPAPRTLADFFNGGGEGTTQGKLPFQSKITIAPDSVFAALPASMRKLIGEQLMVMQMMEKSPVLLISPYVITVK